MNKTSAKDTHEDYIIERDEKLIATIEYQKFSKQTKLKIFSLIVYSFVVFLYLFGLSFFPDRVTILHLIFACVAFLHSIIIIYKFLLPNTKVYITSKRLYIQEPADSTYTAYNKKNVKSIDVLQNNRIIKLHLKNGKNLTIQTINNFPSFEKALYKIFPKP